MEAPANIASAATASLPLKGKGFAVRALAFLVDVLVQVVLFLAAQLAAVAILVVPVIVIQLATGREIATDASGVSGLSGILMVLVGVLYFAFFEWLYGASPGKVLLRMRVIRIDGGPLSFGKALARSLWRLLDFIGFGLVAWGRMKRPLYQRVGDQQTGTVVVSSKDPIVQKHFRKRDFVLALVLSFGVTVVVACVVVVLMIRLK